MFFPSFLGWIGPLALCELLFCAKVLQATDLPAKGKRLFFLFFSVPYRLHFCRVSF
jgi:hypothetical protein